MEKVGKLVVSVLSVVLMCALYWLWLPPLSIAYASGFLFIGLCVIILISNIAMWVSDFGIAGVIAFLGFAILLILWIGGAFFWKFCIQCNSKTATNWRSRKSRIFRNDKANRHLSNSNCRRSISKETGG